MSGLADVVSGLFRMPGEKGTLSAGILRRAAGVHEVLLARASAAAVQYSDISLATLVALLNRPTWKRRRRRLLCHPLLIEGLHGLAQSCADVQRWHACVATPSIAGVVQQHAPQRFAATLGNVLLALQLRADPSWRGELALCTDHVGRLRFPFSDWSIALYREATQPQNAMVAQDVRLVMSADQSRWLLRAAAPCPFLVMPREDCIRIVAQNAKQLGRDGLAFPNAEFRPRLQCAVRLSRSRVRYDPVYFVDFAAHAGLTGAIVAQVLEAVRANSPRIYREFCLYIHAVRGFELPESSKGLLHSFSDPATPGVINVNIPYTSQHEPRLSPFCFTWFAHELAHTKNYLIDSIAYRDGWTFVENPSDLTPLIPRYGRRLSVRSLFQIPYVHLYEWVLLMDFVESNFDGLPWAVEDDSVPVGEDLCCEIEDAFDLICACARLTPLGDATVAHQRRLFARAKSRWRALQPRIARGTSRMTPFPNMN